MTDTQEQASEAIALVYTHLAVPMHQFKAKFEDTEWIRQRVLNSRVKKFQDETCIDDVNEKSERQFTRTCKLKKHHIQNLSHKIHQNRTEI